MLPQVDLKVSLYEVYSHKLEVQLPLELETPIEFQVIVREKQGLKEAAYPLVLVKDFPKKDGNSQYRHLRGNSDYLDL